MSRQVKIISFDDFSSGVFQRSSIFADMENPLAGDFGFKSAADANNVIMGRSGLEKFSGYDKYLPMAIPGSPVITGIYEYKKTGPSADSYLIVCAGDKIYDASGAVLTEVYTGITPNVFFNFVTFNNVCILLNGVDDPIYFDGIICAPITFNDPDEIFDGAKPRLAEIFRNRIFYSGDSIHPSRVWTPKPGTYDDFDNSLSLVDSFDVSVGDGYKIIGIKALTKDILVLYKEGSILRLSGSSPFGTAIDAFRLEEISRETGCLATRTIVQVGKDHFFLSQTGLKRLSTVNEYGDVQVFDPSYQLKSAFENVNYSSTAVENAFSTYLKREQHLYLHVPEGSNHNNTQIYVYDPMTGANMPRNGINASCGAVVARTYFTGDYSGNIHRHLGVNNYAGERILSHWESKWLPIEGLNNKKIFRNLLIYFETSGTTTIVIQWSLMKMDGSVFTSSKTTGSVSSDIWDTGAWDTAIFDADENTVFHKNNLGRGRAIKIKIINNNANETWKIRRIELGVQNLGRVGT